MNEEITKIRQLATGGQSIEVKSNRVRTIDRILSD